MSDSRIAGDSFVERYAAWLVAVPIASIALFLSFAREIQIGFFLPDDAFYYLKIAGNAANGLGLSFDGLHATNGFQFLWQMVLIPLMWVSRLTHIDPLVFVPLLEGAFVIAGAIVLLRTVRSLGAPAGPTVVGLLLVIANPFILKPLFSAMETSLDFAVLAWLWSFVALIAARKRPLNRREALLVGALGVVAMLARFDNLVLLPALAVAYHAADRESWVRRSAETAAVVALGLVAYLAWNQLDFGIALPVSGAVKSWMNFPEGFSIDLWAQRVFSLAKWLVVPGLLVVMGVALILGLRSRGRFRSHPEEAWLSSWIALFVGVGLHIAYFVLYMQLYIATFWYYVPEFVAFAVLGAWLAEVARCEIANRGGGGCSVCWFWCRTRSSTRPTRSMRRARRGSTRL